MNLRNAFEAIIPRYPELKGQVAIVTGAAKGIGHGIALRLAREGMHVVGADIDREGLATTGEAMRELGVSFVPISGDMSSAEDIESLFATVLGKFGTVDLLVNNAADLERRRLLDEHLPLLDLQLATNVRGPYLCSRRAAAFPSWPPRLPRSACPRR